MKKGVKTTKQKTKHKKTKNTKKQKQNKQQKQKRRPTQQRLDDDSSVHKDIRVEVEGWGGGLSSLVSESLLMTREKERQRRRVDR